MEWMNDNRRQRRDNDRVGVGVQQHPPGFSPVPGYGGPGAGNQGLGGSSRGWENGRQEARANGLDENYYVYDTQDQAGGRAQFFNDKFMNGSEGSQGQGAAVRCREIVPPSRRFYPPPGFQSYWRPAVSGAAAPPVGDLRGSVASVGGAGDGAYRLFEASYNQEQRGLMDFSQGSSVQVDNGEGNRGQGGVHAPGPGRGRGAGSQIERGFQDRLQRGRGTGMTGRARYMPNLHGGSSSQPGSGNQQNRNSSLQASVTAAREAAAEALHALSVNGSNYANGATSHSQPVRPTVNRRSYVPSVSTHMVVSEGGSLRAVGSANAAMYQQKDAKSDEDARNGGRYVKGASFSVPNLVQELQGKLSKGQLECMICYDMVGRKAAVWSCASCYSIFHLACIKKWARTPSSADLSLSGQGQAFAGNWRCPGCQSVQLISAKDIRYECFCKSVVEPAMNYYLVPHSCGETCNKPLDKGKNQKCQHHCTLQCHPGPCPPCMTLLPPRQCPCGKTTLTRRCSDQQRSSDCCGQTCGHTLSCGRHSCTAICHDGPCGDCEVALPTKCFCGKDEQVMKCGELEHGGDFSYDKGLFSCRATCGANLSCGNHYCRKRCHGGSCGGCGLSPSTVRTCPCGKQSLEGLLGEGKQRLTCLDPIPTCPAICGKLLSCKKHRCENYCHNGPCRQCVVPTEQKCCCGTSTQIVPCHLTFMVQGESGEGEEPIARSFLCERNCGKKKSCGRHRCNNKCCKAAAEAEGFGAEHDLHTCMLKCGKKLRCKQHDCQERCHTGHCPPCLESTFTELSCACGMTSVPPPVPCGTVLPSCPNPCSLPQACGHRPTHLCHFGDCPPCAVAVAKECAGGHVILRGVPCGSREVKCNNHCGRTRRCGLHACARPCHLPPCDSPLDESEPGDRSSLVGKARMSCGQACGAPRRDCPHNCAAPCHPSAPCPDSPCRALVKITCPCGRLTGEVQCDAAGGWGGASVEGLPPHLQAVEGSSRGQRQLACDDKCAKLEKRRILADAFGAITPGEPVVGVEGGLVGSELIAELSRREPQWVCAVEDRFKYLVLGGKTAAAGGLRAHVFCALPFEKREAIHQLADRWGLAVTGVGREPRRFLIAHVTSKSKVPSRSFLTKPSLPGAGQALPPLFNPGVDMEPGLVVALFDLPREADVSTLVLRFGGECELVWLNDRNALAVFGDAARATTALRRVDHATSYHGAVVTPHAVGGSPSSSSRPNGWGQPSGTPTSAASQRLSTLKTPSRKKVTKESNWVEDAWGEESSREGLRAAWQRKEAPMVVSKNPWGALEPESGNTGNSASDADSFGVGHSAGVQDAGAEVEDDWEKAVDGGS